MADNMEERDLVNKLEWHLNLINQLHAEYVSEFAKQDPLNYYIFGFYFRIYISALLQLARY